MKTSNEIVLNFLLTLSRSISAKKAPKVSSEYENFSAKFLKKKKTSNEHFNLCEAETSLDEIIKFG